MEKISKDKKENYLKKTQRKSKRRKTEKNF